MVWPTKQQSVIVVSDQLQQLHKLDSYYEIIVRMKFQMFCVKCNQWKYLQHH